MSRIANRIIAALAIPASDVLKVGSDIVAVDPKWDAPVRAYLTSQSQKSFLAWYDRGYALWRLPYDSHDNHAVIINSSGLPGVLRAHDIATTEVYRIPEAFTTGYIESRLLDGYITGTGVVMGLGMTFMQNGVNEAAQYYCHNKPVYGHYKRKRFMGRIYGPSFNVKMPTYNVTGVGDATLPMTQGALNGSYPMYLPVLMWPDVHTAEVQASSTAFTHEAWPLIEGPVVIERAEFYEHSAVDGSYTFGFIASTNGAIAECIDVGILSGNYPGAKFSTAKLKADTGGGAVILFKPGVTTSDINPYRLYSRTHGQADRLITSGAVVDGFDLSTVPVSWDEANEIVAVFSTRDADKLPAAYRWSTDVIQEGGTIELSVGADGVVTISPIAIGAPLLSDLVQWTADARGMGYVVNITSVSVLSEGVTSEIVEIVGGAQRVPATIFHSTTGSLMDSQSIGDALGVAILNALRSPLTANQRVPVNVLLRPGFMASNTVI